MKRILALALLASALSVPVLAHAADGDVTTVDSVVVVAPSPLGGGVARDRLGETITSLGADDLEKTGTLSFTDALERDVPGVNVSDTQGNPFTGDVNYRGFTASPLQGSPEGIAVYLDGQRLNEPFGDTVNWDLIPQAAIKRVDLVTSNPAFGLNALGGSLSLQTRDGFSFQGAEASAEGGQFGTRTGALQGGWSNSQYSLYGAVDGGEIDGWRPQSGSSVARAFADLGMKVDGGEIHLIAGTSNSDLGVVGPTPIDLVDANRRAIFTFPQTTDNLAQFAAINGSFAVGGGWNLQGGVHERRFTQAHVDGNDGDFERCSSSGGPALANTLCLEDDDFPSATRPPAAQFQLLTAAGAAIPCPVSTVDTNGCRDRASAGADPRVPYGTIDRTFTTSDTTGASLQLANDEKIGDRKNNFTAGATYDSSNINFHANSTLGLITPDLDVTTANYALPGITGPVPGLGQIIHSGPQVAYGPADLADTTSNTGAFASDTLDLAPNLSMTLGGRYNSQDVDLKDLTGTDPSLTADHRFSRFNPAVNLAYRAMGDTFYAGYSETNRAPTALELGCSDPNKPCLLANSLVADPPLSQVVSKTYEAGVRGANDMGPVSLTWSASAFSTDNTNDIVSLASALAGRGYYANVPKTRRTGYDAQINFDTKSWSAFLGYSNVVATYQFTGTLASPNNPQADTDGNIAIMPGDHLGGIPESRFKAGADYKVSDKLTVGLDTQYTGSQYLVGDEGNDNPKLPAYWTTDARIDYALSKKVSVFARISNLFNTDYFSYGTYFDSDGVQKVTPQPLPDDPNPETVTPGAPRAIYLGLKATF